MGHDAADRQNAYYNAQMNDINFPPACCSPRCTTPKMDDAPNYGNTGGTIGHELVHGLTTRAASSTPRATSGLGGPLATPRPFRAARRLRGRTSLASTTVVDDIKINSKLTLAKTWLTWAAWCWPGAWQMHVAGKALPARMA